MKKFFCKVILPVAFILLAVAFIYVLIENRRLKEAATAGSPYISEGCTNPCTGNLTWIKLSQAIKMVSEYRTNQATGINLGITNRLKNEIFPAPLNGSFNDSRFIVFPMDTIKNFICTIDNMLKNSHPVNADGNPIKTCDLGIKFFYAAYPGLDPRGQISNTYKGRHTLILVPSYLDTKTNMYTEFFPSAINTTTKQPYPLNQLINWDSAGTLHAHGVEPLPLLTMSLKDQNVGKNHGTLCPPPDGCFSAILESAGGN